MADGPSSTSVEAGDANIYVVDADGGVPRRATHEPSADTTAP